MDLCLTDDILKWTRNRSSSSGDLKISPEQAKRTNKPLMEKRRRARINRSLAELRSILLTNYIQKEVKGHGKEKHQKQSKLEKADILEMTVRHFQMINVIKENDIDKYRAGFTDCAKEVERFLNTPDIQTAALPDLNDLDCKIKLLKHLQSCIVEIQPKELAKSEETSIPLFLDLSPEENELSSQQFDETVLRNLFRKSVSEKENFFLKSNPSPLNYFEKIKQQPSEPYSNNEESSSNDESVKRSDETGVNHLESPYLSTAPAITNADIDFSKLQSIPEYIMPFLSQLSKTNRFFNAPISDSGSDGSVIRYAGVEDPNKMSLEWKNNSTTNENNAHIYNEYDNDEPLDFSMHSEIRNNDPMWRPW